MRTINITDIRVNGGTQSRAQISREVVSEYAEAMQAGAEFPPLVVFYDGASYWLADGFHRYQAFAQINAHDVPADVRQGTQRDAILFSVGANASHGLRRTNDDKRRAVMVLLNDPEWAKWSNREIARQCGVSDMLVGGMRKDVTANSCSEPRTYTTKHGTQAAMNTANIGGGSKAHQKAAPQQSQENTAPERVEQADQSNDDQETPAEEIDPEVAAVMRKHSGLTREALLRDYAELVVKNKKERAQDKAEIGKLKAKLADLEADDKTAVIRRLQKSVSHADSEKWRANEETARAMRQVYALKKRVEELERMGVPL